MLKFVKPKGDFFDTKSDLLAPEKGFADCQQALFFTSATFSKRESSLTIFKAFNTEKNLEDWKKRIKALEEKGYISNLVIRQTKEPYALPRGSRYPGPLSIGNFFKCEDIMRDLFPSKQVLFSIKYKTNVVRKITVQ